MARTSGTRATWRTYLCSLISSLAGIGALAYFAEAIGAWGDDSGARIRAAIIAVLLLAVFLGCYRLGLRWGPPRGSG